MCRQDLKGSIAHDCFIALISRIKRSLPTSYARWNIISFWFDAAQVQRTLFVPCTGAVIHSDYIVRLREYRSLWITQEIAADEKCVSKWLGWRVYVCASDMRWKATLDWDGNTYNTMNTNIRQHRMNEWKKKLSTTITRDVLHCTMQFIGRMKENCMRLSSFFVFYRIISMRRDASLFVVRHRCTSMYEALIYQTWVAVNDGHCDCSEFQEKWQCTILNAMLLRQSYRLHPAQTAQ